MEDDDERGINPIVSSHPLVVLHLFQTTVALVVRISVTASRVV